MSTRTRIVKTAEASGRPLLRLASACLAGGLAASAISGCRTTGDASKRKPDPNPPKQASAENTLGSRSDFHKDVSHDQGFNVHVELGRVYETQSNFETAVVEYQKAIEICDKKGSVVSGAKLGPAQRSLAERRLAAAYDRMGKFTQAEVHYGKALHATPKDPKVWNDVGYSYYLQSRLADAERSLKTADKIEPNNPQVLTNLGLTLAAAGKYDEALAALSRAGGPAVGQANLGFILAAMGKTEEAKSHYEAALAAQPEMAPARYALAQLELQSGQVPAGSPAPRIPNASQASQSGLPAVPTVMPTAPKPSPDFAVVSTAAPGSGSRPTLRPGPVPVPVPVPVPIAVMPASLPVKPFDASALPPLPALLGTSEPAKGPPRVPARRRTVPTRELPGTTSALAPSPSRSTKVVAGTAPPVDRDLTSDGLPKLPPEIELRRTDPRHGSLAGGKPTTPLRDNDLRQTAFDRPVTTTVKPQARAGASSPKMPTRTRTPGYQPIPSNPTPPTPW
jgi:Flp pilus assembly protein TadD